MTFFLRVTILLFAILMLCIGGVSWASTLKGTPGSDEMSGSLCIGNQNREISAIVADVSASSKMVQPGLCQKEQYCRAGFKVDGIPESGSFLIFISGFISMIGIGWVRKKKI